MSIHYSMVLSWDIHNKEDHTGVCKDVIHEYSLKTKESAKAVYYCFRAGGANKFFLETKKPSVHIKESVAPAFQVRGYG